MHSKLALHNWFTDKKAIEPINDNQIKWHTYGPNFTEDFGFHRARRYIAFDVIRRVLSYYFGYDIIHHMHIVYISDDIIKYAHDKAVSFSSGDDVPDIFKQLIKSCQTALHVRYQI
ncbi:unnamed protein product [Rotaria sp. Silwood1]|nr:unnamed protein product [Rotaria sp. Silwood1]CAF1683856.1 unnamed protein product [Rotaria sp. Silwood1]CAF3901404.1 unnamed protein product [Rotaria sp. Silwood1]CAF3950391.1 unnamed protein product [Rotaria sp. Silwood1]CAF4908674.1 unnamed protein product [Rotaria sp. Silwood1]